MTYVCIDIRDTTGESVIKENAPATILDDSHYIDCIKRLLKFGERYVIEIPATKLDIPVFFQIKEKKEDYIVIEYVKIDFIKYGTGKGSISPRWEEIKDSIRLNNTQISKIYPFDKNKEYKSEAYFYIRNDVKAFYEI